MIRNLSILRHVVVLGAVALAIALFVVSMFGSFGISQMSGLASVKSAVLVDFANDSRQDADLPPLTRNLSLEQAAEAKALDMLEGQYFSHISPDGMTPWFYMAQAGYGGRWRGENLAADFFDSRGVHQAWMNSPGHRKNILDPRYTDVGIATVSGFFQGQYTTIVVQMFGGVGEAYDEVAPVHHYDTRALQEILAQLSGAQVNNAASVHVLQRVLLNPSRVVAFIYVGIMLLLLLTILHDAVKAMGHKNYFKVKESIVAFVVVAGLFAINYRIFLTGVVG